MKFQNSIVKNMCCFYASNFHLLVMIYTYLKKNKSTIFKTILEENMENEIEEFALKCNLNEEEKRKLIDINWNKSEKYDNEKFKKFMFELASQDDEVTIILKGEEDELRKNRKMINDWVSAYLKSGSIKLPNINVVCCIDILKLTKSMNLIMQEYEYMLNTSGEHHIA